MPLTHKWIVPLCLLVVTLCGCQGPKPVVITSSRQQAPAYMLSIEQLAARLNLAVAGNNGRYYELKNHSNRVLVFTHPGGNLYVNGQDAGPVGSTVEANGKTWFSELLVPKIRGWLKAGSFTAYTPAPATTPSRPRSYASGTVVIDAGHGGRDPGAISYLGDHEKRIVLSIAKKIASRLESRGVTVVMTRDGDYFVELDERCAIANRVNPDLFVSVHADSNGNRMHQGFTVYIAPTASDTSRRAGRLFESHLSRAGINSKGIRTNDYRVLVKTTCPAVLVECGFLSNPSEAALLLDGTHQNRLADAVTEAIIQSLAG